MKRSGKIFDEAHHAVVVVATPERVHLTGRRKRQVGMGLFTRREVLKHFAQQHQQASYREKQMVLTDFVRLTGYHRKYAISLLQQAHEEQTPVKRSSIQERKNLIVVNFLP